MTKITMYSNYLNHHQLPFAKEMVRLTNDNFYFVSQKAISEKRISLGYKNISDDYDFVVKTYESDSEMKKAFDLANNSDVVIFGGNSKIDRFVFERIKSNKITFEYSERLNKRNISLYLKIKEYLNMIVYRRIYKNKKLFLLCAGSYVYKDFNEFKMYKNKAYKWGYFPELIEYDENELIKNKNNKEISIIWVGRFIDWKHPELAIKLVEKLIANNISVKLNMIGNGELEDKLKDYVEENKLNNFITFSGSMSPVEVRKKMENADIFVLTSNKQEGWGAVLNEAMNSGCACVASDQAGATNYLINNGVNGLIFESENINDLYNKVKSLVDDDEYRQKIMINGYKTIKNTWNAKVAAERFVTLANCIENGEDTPYKDGPCSKA